ncbi:uncharacterized protein LOC123301460 [Chrysoperla carnea]|uniref:uncharacterized protein LOC123301460 n=1 Tax=Chrysoperla carnea TaxID=189513 RepID=UPI001D08F69A|nr:uncharacterized protein LOC123301460 [Chrysoperla carnea]
MPEFKEQKDTLFLKLPTTIEEELTIKNLHPDIEDVRIPRQKRARFCTIKFTDLEKCEKVKNDLSEKKVDGKRIIVAYGRKKIIKDEKQCIKLIVMKLPDDIHKKEVQKAIPKATKVKIRRANKKRKFTWALLIFESKSDAEQIVSNGTLNIKDVDVEVKYYKKRKLEDVKEKNKSKKELKKKSKSKEQTINRYYQVTPQNLKEDNDDSDNSADSVMTDVSDNSDLESFDLEYTGNFNSDSD